MSWKDKLPGCFGSVDKKFARHHLDNERAAKLLAELVEEQVQLADVVAEAKKHLASTPPEQQSEELAEVQRKFGPWLEP